MSNNLPLPQYHPNTQKARGYEDWGVGDSKHGNRCQKFVGEKNDVNLWGSEVAATSIKSVRLTPSQEHLHIKKSTNFRLNQRGVTRTRCGVIKPINLLLNQM